jgi:hypothetical protein
VDAYQDQFVKAREAGDKAQKRWIELMQDLRVGRQDMNDPEFATVIAHWVAAHLSESQARLALERAAQEHETLVNKSKDPGLALASTSLDAMSSLIVETVSPAALASDVQAMRDLSKTITGSTKVSQDMDTFIRKGLGRLLTPAEWSRLPALAAAVNWKNPENTRSAKNLVFQSDLREAAAYVAADLWHMDKIVTPEEALKLLVTGEFDVAKFTRIMKEMREATPAGEAWVQKKWFPTMAAWRAWMIDRAGLYQTMPPILDLIKRYIAEDGSIRHSLETFHQSAGGMNFIAFAETVSAQQSFELKEIGAAGLEDDQVANQLDIAAVISARTLKSEAGRTLSAKDYEEIIEASLHEGIHFMLNMLEMTHKRRGFLTWPDAVILVNKLNQRLPVAAAKPQASLEDEVTRQALILQQAILDGFKFSYRRKLLREVVPASLSNGSAKQFTPPPVSPGTSGAVAAKIPALPRPPEIRPVTPLAPPVAYTADATPAPLSNPARTHGEGVQAMLDHLNELSQRLTAHVEGISQAYQFMAAWPRVARMKVYLTLFSQGDTALEPLLQEWQALTKSLSAFVDSTSDRVLRKRVEEALSSARFWQPVAVQEGAPAVVLFESELLPEPLAVSASYNQGIYRVSLWQRLATQPKNVTRRTDFHFEIVNGQVKLLDRMAPEKLYNSYEGISLGAVVESHKDQRLDQHAPSLRLVTRQGIDPNISHAPLVGTFIARFLSEAYQMPLPSGVWVLLYIVSAVSFVRVVFPGFFGRLFSKHLAKASRVLAATA